MKHSVSKTDLDFDFSQGPDLSQYAVQFAKERNSRTLTLRTKRPTIASVFGKNPASLRPSLVPDVSLFINPEYVIRTLSNGSAEEIKTTLSGLSTAVETSTTIVSPITSSPEVAEAFCNALASTFPPDVIVSLLGTVGTLYPLSKEVQDAYIDNGLPFSLLNFLSIGIDEYPNWNLISSEVVSSTLDIISTIAANNFYGRNSLLCDGLIDPLIQIAQHSPFMDQACTCIFTIFNNPAPLESESIMEVIPQISSLLKLSSKTAVEQILLAYVCMTNKDTSIVSNLYDIELPTYVIPLLDDPDLIAVSLKVVGNLSVAQPPQIRIMLDLDLLGKLRSLLVSQPDYIPDIYWILSNLVEAYSPAILPTFDEEFLRTVLNHAREGEMETKKEATFFLSTVILFSHSDSYDKFMNPDVVGLLVQMLACDVGMIIFRCIDTILAFVRHMTSNPDSLDHGVATIFHTNIMDTLNELAKNDDPLLGERAAYLVDKLSELSEIKE